MRIVEVTSTSQYIEKIKNECQPYLRSVEDPLMLFRGMENSGKIVRKKVRKDNRIPKAMKKPLHNMINEYFVEHFGHPFRNGVFCATSMNMASGFGSVHVIFPIGEYEALWSPKIEDLNYYMVTDEFKKLRQYINFARPGSADYTMMKNQLWSGLDVAKYIHNQLPDARAFNHEVMIWCDEYYAIPMHYITNQHPGLSNKEALAEFRKVFKQ
jgi:hypothetical protein